MSPRNCGLGAGGCASSAATDDLRLVETATISSVNTRIDALAESVQLVLARLEQVSTECKTASYAADAARAAAEVAASASDGSAGESPSPRLGRAQSFHAEL